MSANIVAYPDFGAVNIVAGHYGVGKTNFSLNWALSLARAGKHVVLADFDVVNPYFRSSDYAAALEAEGIELISPLLAGSSLDTPSVSGRIATVVEQAYAQGDDGNLVLIIDAGGDDAGATALARFSAAVLAGPYRLIYVVNKYRNLTQDAASALEILREIELASGLRVTGVVGNSHLREETDVDCVVEALPFALDCARAAKAPLVCCTVPEHLAEQVCSRMENTVETYTLYPVSMLVRFLWE